MNELRMPALLVEHHRPGFYFRVLEAGEVRAGDEIVKVDDRAERMSVAESDALCFFRSFPCSIGARFAHSGAVPRLAGFLPSDAAACRWYRGGDG